MISDEERAIIEHIGGLIVDVSGVRKVNVSFVGEVAKCDVLFHRCRCIAYVRLVGTDVEYYFGFVACDRHFESFESYMVGRFIATIYDPRSFDRVVECVKRLAISI